MQNLPVHVYTAFQSTQKPNILLQGFQKYLRAEYPITYADHKEIYSDGISSLNYYQAKNEAVGALFIVPSLINGSEIFDLTEEYSLIRFLTHNAIDVYLVNWGDLSSSFEGGLEDLFSKKMDRLWIAAHQNTRLPLHVLGYCLGGTLCATFYENKRKKTQPESLTFLATPLNFRIKNAPWQYAQNYRQSIEGQIMLQGALTKRMMQSHFLHIRPDFIFQKFQKFLEMKKGSIEEKRFVTVERWLNEGADLPQKLSLDLIETYFIKSKAADAIHNLPKDMRLAFIFSDQDQIVPPDSADIARKTYPDARYIKNECGHVGMMVGRGAKLSVWKPFLKFLRSDQQVIEAFRVAAN